MVRGRKVAFRLDGGRMLSLNASESQLLQVDRARASTVHVFQRLTVDTAIAAVEANHPNLTAQNTLQDDMSPAQIRAGVYRRAPVPSSRHRCRAMIDQTDSATRKG